ncbi:MAG TPA: PAS domain S-box protein [Candidatus Acidoferrales bacterium]
MGTRDTAVQAYAMESAESATARSSGLALATSAPPNDFAFRAVFDSSDEALTLVDESGVIRRANRRACELIAAKSDEVVGSRLVSYLAQPAVKEFETCMNWRGRRRRWRALTAS